MNKIEIDFKGRKNIKAIVKLNMEQYRKRMHGLIQYLSSFCSEIEYITPMKQKEKGA